METLRKSQDSYEIIVKEFGDKIKRTPSMLVGEFDNLMDDFINKAERASMAVSRNVTSSVGFAIVRLTVMIFCIGAVNLGLDTISKLYKY